MKINFEIASYNNITSDKNFSLEMLYEKYPKLEDIFEDIAENVATRNIIQYQYAKKEIEEYEYYIILEIEEKDFFKLLKDIEEATTHDLIVYPNLKSELYDCHVVLYDDYL